jgi:predicted kinase
LGEVTHFNFQNQKAMWQITTNKDWGALECQFPWVADMVDVPQDPIFHAEGNVAVHTQMVIEALEGLEGFKELEEQEQEVLYAAGLLHDVEKRSTTIINEQGEIRSPRHSIKGEHSSREILYREHPAPFDIRESVAKLVRHHGSPIWLFEKKNPQKALFKCSWDVNTQHLYLLAKADMLGRICENQGEFLERVELFKEYCLEQGCWGEARPFPSDLAKFHYFHKANSYADYVPFDDTRSEVVMMCGLPGAGKDTFIQEHYPDYPVVSLDSIRREFKISPKDARAQGRIAQIARERMKVFLRKGMSFVFNATNLTRAIREKNVALFTTYKARTHIAYVETDFRELIRRNKKREHPVPVKIIRKMLAGLEMPSRTEAHTVEYHVGDSQ